jgi:ribokinase
MTIRKNGENQPEKIEVVGLGQACIDYLGRVPNYPPEDGKIELLDLHMLCGGPASTALVTLSRLSIPTTFLGSISDDPLGIAILKGLEDEKVDTSYLKITPGYTSQFAFIAVTKESGNRSVFWHRGSVPHLKRDDIDLSPFSDARILHFDSLMIEASLEAGTMRDGTLEILSLVDVLIASEKFAEPLLGADFSPESALKTLKRLCPGDVIVTLGSKGSIGIDDEDTVIQKAFPVEAVDTTGAGDVYHGAYIYGILQGWDMPECMRFASATAALKCMAIGAQAGIPKLERIKQFMENA